MAEQMKNIKMGNKDNMYFDCPCFSLKETQVPEIKDWEVGKEYVMEVKVKMTNKNEDMMDKSVRASFEVVAYNYESDITDDPSDPVRKTSTDRGYMPN